MIIEFTVENYLSFKNKTTISMVSSKSFREHKNSHTIEIDKKIALLKSAVIYGNNASGKSNLLKAMQFMKGMVMNSFRDALTENRDRLSSLEKFALNSKSQIDPSYFEISFIHKNTKYRYGFQLDFDKVVSEWLFHTTSKEVLLFKRDLQKIEINKSSFKEAIGKEKEARHNVLFLSMLATLNKELSSELIQWFNDVNFISGISDSGHKKYTVDRLKYDLKFNNWVLHFIKYLEISNLSTSEEEYPEFDTASNKDKNDDLNNLFPDKNRKFKKDQIITYHRKYDENNLLVDTVPFNFERQESEGTKKLIYLLGPWYDTLKNGKILIVDELDSRLHSHLTSRLISLFHTYNKNKAQLIFVSHDPTLLDKDTFRRDQIWFAEKDQFGSSNLLSLGDYKSTHVRNTSSFSKNYLLGKYGAIPYFDYDEKLTNFIYD